MAQSGFPTQTGEEVPAWQQGAWRWTCIVQWLSRGKGPAETGVSIKASQPASLMAHQSSLAAGIISRHSNLFSCCKFLCTKLWTPSLCWVRQRWLNGSKLKPCKREQDPMEGLGEPAQSCSFSSPRGPPSSSAQFLSMISSFLNECNSPNYRL